MKLLRTIQRRTFCRDLSLGFGVLGSGSTGLGPQAEKTLGRLGVGNFPYPTPIIFGRPILAKSDFVLEPFTSAG